MASDTLAKQIAAECAAFGITFDPDKLTQQWIIESLVYWLQSKGVASITELQLVPATDFYATFLGESYDADPIPADRFQVLINLQNQPLAGGSFDSITYTQLQTFRTDNRLSGTAPFFVASRAGYNWELYPRDLGGGLVYFVARKYKRTGGSFGADLRGLISDLGPVIPVALAVAGIFSGGLATSLGNNLLASIGVADATFAPVVGNLALSTAMTGGNVGAAVKSAAVNYAGSGVSGIVVENSGIQTLGAVSGAATTAALNGGNVQQAIIYSAVLNGVQVVNMDDYSDGVDYTPTDSTDYGGGATDTGGAGGGTDQWGNEVQTDVNGDTVTFDDQGNVTTTFADGTGYEVQNADGSWYLLDANGNILQSSGITDTSNIPPARSTPTGVRVPASSGGGITWNDIKSVLPQLAQIFRGQNPVSGMRTVTGNGITTPNRNGTISTMGTNGRMTTTRMPANTPYQFPDGSYVYVDSQGIVHNFSALGVETISTLPAGIQGASGGMGVLVAMGVGLLLINDHH